MTRVERMNKVADMAGERKDEATLKLADRLRHVDAEESQLADLHRFREEYIGSDSAATNVAALVNRRRFLDRINEAITFQLAQIERQRRLLEEERKSFREIQAHSQALGKVVQRLTDDQRAHEDRAEQGESDERALRASRRAQDGEE